MIPQDDLFPQKRPSFARVEASPLFLPHCEDPRIVSMGLSAMVRWSRFGRRLTPRLMTLGITKCSIFSSLSLRHGGVKTMRTEWTYTFANLS